MYLLNQQTPHTTSSFFFSFFFSSLFFFFFFFFFLSTIILVSEAKPPHHFFYGFLWFHFQSFSYSHLFLLSKPSDQTAVSARTTGKTKKKTRPLTSTPKRRRVWPSCLWRRPCRLDSLTSLPSDRRPRCVRPCPFGVAFRKRGRCLGCLFSGRQHPPPTCRYFSDYTNSIVPTHLSWSKSVSKKSNLQSLSI